MGTDDARTTYERRLADRTARMERLGRRDGLISHLRLAVFLLALAVAAGSFFLSWLHMAWALLPLAAYVALVVVHDRVIRERRAAAAAAAFYRGGLARLDGTWPGTGVTRDHSSDEDHPYARDLDLFGEGSLFELLCRASTDEGERTLASWLVSPAPPRQVRERQRAVEELTPRLDLREELFVVGGAVRHGVRAGSLARWAEAEPAFGRGRAALLAASVGLAAAAVGALLAWIFGGAGPVPLVAVALVEWVVNQALRGRIRGVVQGVAAPGRQLDVLAGVLRRIEREPGDCEALASIRRSLSAGSRPASASINRLAGLVGWLDAPRNVLFAPVAYLLMWRPFFAALIETWRLGQGGRIGRWLDALGRFEALCSLASHRYEHPGDVFAEMVEQEPLFEATDLGHPLLDESACVRNDVSLGGPVRALIVSGSNMSGKSTLLRSVGLAAVMAQAGGCVRAGRLRLCPLAVGATIRIHDSLLGRTSRFYAEIQRLRLLSDMADGDVPLLFLLDEVLHGTNSRDRLAGATAVLGSLVDRGALGLVVTHDLAIAAAARELGEGVRNVHLADRVEDGRLVFDYRLRDGVVERSNALALMRQVGLPV